MALGLQSPDDSPGHLRLPDAARILGAVFDAPTEISADPGVIGQPASPGRPSRRQPEAVADLLSYRSW